MEVEMPSCDTPKIRSLALAAVLSFPLALIPVAGFAMSPEERTHLDLSEYSVHDKNAGYFNKDERRAELAETNDPALLRVIARLEKRELCAASGSVPVISGAEITPRFYEDRDAWRRAAAPYHDFEDMVSNLAAQQFIAPQKGPVIVSFPCWTIGRIGCLPQFRYRDLKTSNMVPDRVVLSLQRPLPIPSFGGMFGHESRRLRIETWLTKAPKCILVIRVLLTTPAATTISIVARFTQPLLVLR
ncbi:MAG: hypothetical protein QM744_04930 [Mesorhizobium sp.]